MITEEVAIHATKTDKILRDIRSTRIGGFLIHALFWLWNGLFVLLAGIFVIPSIVVPLVSGTIEGSIPVDILLFATVSVLIVAGSIVAGVWFTRNWPSDNAKVALWNIFYGIEGPLLTLIIYRLFFVRELNGSVAVLLGGFFFSVILLGMHTFLSHVKVSKLLNRILLNSWSIPILFALYFGILLSFYVPPAAILLFSGFFSFEWVPFLFSEYFFFILVSLLFFFLTSTLLLFLPIVTTWLFIVRGIESLKRSCSVFGLRTTLLTTLSTGAIFITAILLFDQNQSNDITELLSNPVTTHQERTALLSRESQIRKKLLNAYLASYRYLSTVDNDHIRSMYKPYLPEPVCEGIQKFFNVLAFPFLYQGPYFHVDQQKAESLYEQFFDVPLQKAEKRSINKALNATWNRDEAKAGLLNTNSKFVYLAKQSINVDIKNTLATVTIFEEYQNQTFTDQEIFYYFTLPDNAAVSGLWLSDDRDIPKKYPFTISPRGAAQQVYNNQVFVRQDPALLEKVGPFQYRLRAFPVPAKQAYDMRFTSHNSVLQLWLEYKTIPNPDGSIPLPELKEKRNVYWDKKTKRVHDDQFKHISNKDWIPSGLPGKDITFKDDFAVSINDSCKLLAKRDPAGSGLRQYNEKIAFVIDRSRSMDHVKKELSSALHDAARIFPEASLFLGGYEWSSETMKNNTFDEIQFFGSSTLSDLLRQTYQQLGQTDKFSQIVLCTDEGGYELSKDNDPVLNFKIPVSILHIAGKIPAAYPDHLIETISVSKGIFTSSIDNLKEQFHKQTLEQGDEHYCGRFGSHSVFLQTSDTVHARSAFQEHSELKPLFAQLALQDYASRNDMTKLENLDYVHKLAKDNSLVTRFSSMIVLVNDLQKKELENAENRNDRFDREVESGKENLSTPANPMQVSTVPEPEEWALIICIIIALIVVLRFRKRFFNLYRV